MLVPEPCHDVPWAVLVRDKLWFRKFFATFADVAKTNFCNIFVAKKCCKKIWHFLNVATWNVANFSGVQKLLQTAMLQTFWANLHCCKSQLLQKKKTYGCTPTYDARYLHNHGDSRGNEWLIDWVLKKVPLILLKIGSDEVHDI